MLESISNDEARQFIHIADKYVPTHVIGEGTFSTVYKSIDIENSTNGNEKYVALKNITRTTAPNRVCEELKILRQLQGYYNTIELISACRFEDQIIAVFPYFEYDNFRDFISDCSLIEIKHYMYNLLVALEWTHRNNIIHRDIKPTNFLFNRKTRKGVLIDFGLAQFYEEQTKSKTKEDRTGNFTIYGISNKTSLPPGYFENDGRPKIKAPRAGTRGFRAPEVLLRVEKQTTKIDMWSVGVILLILLTKQCPFFISQEDVDSLVEIANIFGHNAMKKAAHHYGRVWKSNIANIPTARIKFEVLVGNLNPHINLDRDGFDLLYTLMELNEEKRLSASAALKHPFFNDLK